ncbi:hypothetical protein CDD81_4947 [Ophiocordyceps australis]|uniref:CFEM domain-containing protein n=1 Tax=Ophiocordyceps australis TaxID=1399860 RepID=A0A2C5Y9S1_9HYPO|nr:hypothetical protein CDD81_4947 [Ophiocordyceps australis]
MKTAAWIVALATGLAMAQQGLDQLPECAKTCVIKYMSGDELKGCSLGDIKCICTNKDLLSGMSCCLSDACGGEDQRKAIEAAKHVCGSANVEVPDEIVCNAGASSSAGAAPATSSSSAASSSSTAASTATAPAASSTGGSASVKVSSGVAGAIFALLAAL